MLINSVQYGEIEVDEENIILFKEGLPGFETLKKYVLIFSPEPELPFHHLQCVDDPAVSFVITDPFLFVENYDFELDPEIERDLAITSNEDVLVYSIAVIKENLKSSTINLKGPIIINHVKKLGKQVVIDGDNYELRYQIFKKS